MTSELVRVLAAVLRDHDQIVSADVVDDEIEVEDVDGDQHMVTVENG